MLTAILGCFRAGAVAVPVSTMQTATELGTVLADSGARLVVCTPEFTEAVEGALPLAPEVEHLVVAGDATLAVPDAVGQTSWEEFLAAGRAAPDARRAVADTDADAWALWLYTSGTTGLPKAAMHRHANIRHVCETYGAAGARHPARRRDVLGGEAVLRLRHRQLAVLPVLGRCHHRARGAAADARDRAGARRRRAADALLRRARPSTPRCSRATCRTTRSRRSGWPRRRARRCPARCSRGSSTASASTSSTASARPRRCTSSCPTARATSGPAPRARPCRGTTSRSSARTASPCRPASPARCGCAATRSPSATGSGPPPRGRSSRASGWSPATPTSATPTATSPAWAATATCSSPAASGCRRPRSRAG